MAFLAKLVHQVLRDQRERKATKVHPDPMDLPDLLYVVQFRPFVCINSEGENPVTMESMCLLPIPRAFMCPSSEGENPVTMVTTTKVYVYYYCLFLLQGPQGAQGMRGDKGPTGASVSPHMWSSII